MTNQIPDEFIFIDKPFSLVGLKGQKLLTPENFGINPYFSCTACWRGYVMKYVFENDFLILDAMQVNTNDPPKINGIEPKLGGRLFKYIYENLNYKTNFTGKVLLAKDFIQSMYVHMGFQRPIAFKTVIEITVENGEIISLKDLSMKIEEIRSQDVNNGAHPSSNSQKDIEEWVKQTFSLDYDF
ncbi:MAG: hypothetical protein ACW98D_14405 [Promethearchaeota archaeon]|jgi:hypothetical protein